MDKIHDDGELIIKRFACDCKSQEHSLDIAVELLDGRPQYHVNLYMAGKPSWQYRVKQAWKCLKGQDGQMADFLLRSEDIPEIIGMFTLPIYINGTYSYTCGNNGEVSNARVNG